MQLFLKLNYLFKVEPLCNNEKGTIIQERNEQNLRNYEKDENLSTSTLKQRRWKATCGLEQSTPDDKTIILADVRRLLEELSSASRCDGNHTKLQPIITNFAVDLPLQNINKTTQTETYQDNEDVNMNTLNIVRNMKAEIPSNSHYSMDEVIDFSQTFEPEDREDENILVKQGINCMDNCFADDTTLHALGKSLVSTKTGEPKCDILQKKSENEIGDWKCSMQKQLTSDSNVPILSIFSNHSLNDDLVKEPKLSSWNSNYGNNLSDGAKSIVIENDGLNNHVNKLCEEAIEAMEGTLSCNSVQNQNQCNEFHEYEDEYYGGEEYMHDTLPNDGQHLEYLPENLAESRQVWEDPTKNIF